MFHMPLFILESGVYSHLVAQKKYYTFWKLALEIKNMWNMNLLEVLHI